MREPTAGDLRTRVSVRDWHDEATGFAAIDSIFGEPLKRWAKIIAASAATYWGSKCWSRAGGDTAFCVLSTQRVLSAGRGLSANFWGKCNEWGNVWKCRVADQLRHNIWQ